MQADYIDHMGSDARVVNAARVSFDKQIDEEILLSHDDDRLISYLARHGHWTPFGHCTATFRIEAPIFVARQAAKHQVGLVWNEVSRRYVDKAPTFFMPKSWRARPEKSIKQGSGSDVRGQRFLNCIVRNFNRLSKVLYKFLLIWGVCPEQARIVLPQSINTEWYWTGSLAAWARVYDLRTDEHAQLEIQELAHEIGAELSPYFPISWSALTNDK